MPLITQSLTNIYRDYVSGEVRLPSPDSQYKWLITFKLIKSVADTVLEIINAGYYAKPLILIRVIRDCVHVAK